MGLLGFYFKKHGESLPAGAESLGFKLELERKLGLLALAMAPEGVSRLNNVSVTFMQIETIDGDLDDLADGPGTKRSDPKAGEIVGDRDPLPSF